MINANEVDSKFFGVYIISLLCKNKKQFAHWWDSKQVSYFRSLSSEVIAEEDKKWDQLKK